MKNRVNELLDDLSVEPMSEMDELEGESEHYLCRGGYSTKKQVDKSDDLVDTD